MNNDVLFQELNCENAATIQGGAAVTLYNDRDFGGDSFQSGTNMSNLNRTAYNDQASSIKITGGTWRFWTDANFTGQSKALGSGSYSFVQDFGLPNDSISSFRLVLPFGRA
ncbi:beta/gamma crystallin-related protein [Nostoc sp.]|uniref:beta/gamma crystallin-related protein n=1 Tax=Nostoc sp. TaxID=1180 RepID=UPI002FFCE675